MNIKFDDFGLEWDHGDGVKHKADYDDLIRAYEQSRLIPVSERLPEDADDRFYLCVCENHEDDSVPFMCQYDEEYGFGFWRNIFDPGSLGFIDSEFNTLEELEYEKVVAWMQMPEPWRGE